MKKYIQKLHDDSDNNVHPEEGGISGGQELSSHKKFFLHRVRDKISRVFNIRSFASHAAAGTVGVLIGATIVDDIVNAPSASSNVNSDEYKATLVIVDEITRQVDLFTNEFKQDSDVVPMELLQYRLVLRMLTYQEDTEGLSHFVPTPYIRGSGRPLFSCSILEAAGALEKNNLAGDVSRQEDRLARLITQIENIKIDSSLSSAEREDVSDK